MAPTLLYRTLRRQQVASGAQNLSLSKGIVLMYCLVHRSTALEAGTTYLTQLPCQAPLLRTGELVGPCGVTSGPKLRIF